MPVLWHGIVVYQDITQLEKKPPLNLLLRYALNFTQLLIPREGLLTITSGSGHLRSKKSKEFGICARRVSEYVALKLKKATVRNLVGDPIHLLSRK